MAGRSALLTSSATKALLAWICRVDGAERLELALQTLGPGYQMGAQTPAALDREGVPMIWTGRAARALGLTGEASRTAAARALVHGRGPHDEQLRTNHEAARRIDPDTKEKIPQERKPAISWIVAVSKTVSLLLASPDPEVRQAVVEAVERASEAAIAELERRVTVRRGTSGPRSEGVQGLLGVKATHFSSSAGDPHLHVHWVLDASAPALSDGRWVALDTKVFFPAQRAAEARFQIKLQRELTKRLNLNDEDWTLTRVGTVPTPEITALLPAVEAFSKAGAHMKEIAEGLNRGWEGRGTDQNQLFWEIHRRNKAQVAEATEHAIDAAIAAGGTAAETLLNEWHQRLGEHREALAQIKPRTEQAPVRDQQAFLRRVEVILDGSARAKAEQALEKAQKDFDKASKAFNKFRNATFHNLPHPYVFTKNHKMVPGPMREDDFKLWEWEKQRALNHKEKRFKFFTVRAPEMWLVREYQTTIDQGRKYNTLWYAQERARERLEAAEAAIEQVRKDEYAVREKLRAIQDEDAWKNRPFNAVDVATRWMYEGAGPKQANRLAALTLRQWDKNERIHLKDSVDKEQYFNIVAKGMSHDTQLQRQTWGCDAKIVPHELVGREQKIRQMALQLTAEHRQPLQIEQKQIENAGLNAEQAQGVLAAAKGRGITVIQGAAGAGKTELLKQVVAAAKKADMDILALTRNAIFAQELGEQLGVEAHTLAWLYTRGKSGLTNSFDLYTTKRSTLVIMDEAGVTDQKYWDELLSTALKNEKVQMVAVGDRLQTQSIDHYATFGVVINAIQTSEQGKHLFVDMKTSIRCKEWREEHDLLRQGSTQAAEKAAEEGRIAAVEIGEGVERVADLAKEHIDQGEDVIAVAVSNPEAAAIAVAIQTKFKVKRDERTQLRWKDQQTGVGDLVRTRTNDYQKGILNGNVWRVREIDDKGLTLQRKKGKKEDGPKTWVSHEWAKKHLELAYSATVDLTQGLTVDRAIVKVSDEMGISRAYAGATRGKKAPIYVAEVDPIDPRPDTKKALEAVQAAIERNDVDPTMQEILTERQEWEEAERERKRAERERQMAEEQSYHRSRSSSPSQAPSRGPVRQLRR